MRDYLPLLLSALLLATCDTQIPNTSFSLQAALAASEGLAGKSAYLSSSMLTAGNRVYLVGHQDGSFPEIGWHINGEMGGIWNHPIKLMDGFKAQLTIEQERIPLNKASLFVNYPFANKNIYQGSDKNLQIERFQFVPDDTEGMVIQYALQNNNDYSLSCTFDFTGYADLRPTWLAERLDVVDGSDSGTFDAALGAWVVSDSDNPWHVIYGGLSSDGNSANAENNYQGKGTAGTISYPIEVDAGATKVLTFIIAGSYQSESAARTTYQNIQTNLPDLFERKQTRYQSIAAQTKLTIPDKKMEQTFEWLKYNCDWLVRTVPEIGTGIGAGIPDYPWWFGVDSEYALRGYMAIGQEEIVYKTIQLLDSISNAVNGNGRIVHEVSTNGMVFNPGNINETPQFATLIWNIYRWNGDRAFLEKYFPTIQKGLTWLMQETDADKNGFPDGFGMMEIHGLDSEMIDVAVYTQAAFADAAKMATALGKTQLAAEYQKAAAELKTKINQRFWSEEFQSYADFIGTDKQALHLIDDAIVRADTLNKPWAVKELQNTQAAIKANPSNATRPFVLHHNWVVNTPMEMGIAPPDKAKMALRTAEKYVNPFGVFVTGIDRDASAGSDDGSFKGSKIFSYTGAVMTLPTGVQVIAENNYGNPDKALHYLQKMTRTFSYALPGSMYEVSPDYGMMTQAWNIYSFAVPIVEQFFGIQPNAAEKTIRIQLLMPTVWDEAKLENVKVADNIISISYQKVNQEVTLNIDQSQTDWTIEVVIPAGRILKNKSGELTPSDGLQILSSNESQIEIIYE